MLIHFGVKPYIIFDGDHLPSKAKTEAGRRERRRDAKREGLDLLNAGKTAAAHKTLQKAIDVTPQMTHELIQELKKLNVAYVVAPYEADAQLAYLEKKGIINGVLSEDSDLLVFGVSRLLTKLDQYGNCVEVNRNEFASCKDISLIGWTDADFRRMAILSGCDYLDSIPNMGLKTAYRMVRKYKAIDKILRMVQLDGFFVPADYAANFEQAERSFLHHRVFCPIAKGLILLNDLPHGLEEDDMPYLGSRVEAETAVLVACGELDPMTKLPIMKRRQIVPARTPLSGKSSMLGENRRHTFGTTDDLKSDKKINSFFKQRTPLAELDPNSLTPSPSQQRLLQRHSNASWAASPSPSPAVRTSLPNPRRSDTDAFLAKASTLSDYKPSKRQRLCSEVEDRPSPTVDVASPFFTPNTNAMKASGKLKKAKRATFGIFSDDSVDDILAHLPEPITTPDAVLEPDVKTSAPSETVPPTGVQAGMSGPEADLTRGCEVADAVDCTEVVPASSPPAIEDDVPTFSKETSFVSGLPSQENSAISQSTAATSVTGDADSESFVDLLEYHVQNQKTALLHKFSYQGPAACSDAPKMEGGKDVPVVSEVKVPDTQSREEKIHIGREALANSETEAPKRSLTPLQQLRQSALRRTQSLQSLSPSQKDSTNLHPTRDEMDSDGKMDMNDSTAGTRVEMTKGSEDLIVPNSDDEDDELPPNPPKLDLGRFAYNAR